jgi:hypothetical protein
MVMSCDVILIHPPAIYDFREKAIFPGPIAYTVGGSGIQFIMPSIGMLSIAESSPGTGTLRGWLISASAW